MFKKQDVWNQTDCSSPTDRIPMTTFLVVVVYCVVALWSGQEVGQDALKCTAAILS